MDGDGTNTALNSDDLMFSEEVARETGERRWARARPFVITASVVLGVTTLVFILCIARA
jgi:hypothetical protein